jgi:N-carbamoylputrescine amidase
MNQQPSSVRVAAIQCALGGDYNENVAHVESFVREAAARGAQIILPPELFAGVYFCRTEEPRFFAWAEPFRESPTITRFAELSAALDVAIPVSFFERDGQSYYNSVAVVDGGRILGRYRKSHIPDGPGYEEKFYFRPGSDGFRTFDTRFARIGVGICWDQWFPECARAMVLQDAELLFYPTAIGSEPEEPEFDSKDPWQRAMIGHAVCNVVPVIAANRIGNESGQLFYGSSFICDQRGDKRAELGRNEEGVILGEFDRNRVREDRASMGFFRDRRPELYGSITER